MSDSSFYATKSERESTIEAEYFEALVYYLADPSEIKKNLALTKMRFYTETFRNSASSKEILNEFESLDTNEKKSWETFSKNSETSIFLSKPILKQIFLLAARRRGIGKFQWVI